MKIEKISTYTLLGLIVLSIVMFVAFFTIGWDNPDGEMIGSSTVPMLTDAILGYMYVLVVATAAACVWAVGHSIACNKGNDSAATTGVPGKKITVCTLVLLVAALAVGACLNLDETAFTSTSGTVTSATWMIISDAFLVSIGILFVAAVVAVAVSMSGMLTKTATK